MIDEKLISIRKYLHKHPELSNEERETRKYLIERFERDCPSAEILSLDSGGFVVQFKGNGKASSVMLRCELDALPIEETNSFEYRSNFDGVSHKCGHDGHMTILYATGLELEQSAPKGDVFLLFQPAEEIGAGAKATIEDGGFNSKINPDYAFALHNVPGFPLHSIQVKKNNFTPAVISATISFIGKTSHAAEPQNGLNPSYFASEIELYCKEQNVTDPNNPNFKIITPIFINIGSKDFGVSAGTGSAGFTMRTHLNETMEELKEDFISKLDWLSKKYGIPYMLEWSHEFSAIENNDQCVEFIQASAEENDLTLETMKAPFPWGEDFGLFTEKFKGAMFGLGSGEHHASLHNPDYDFPDELIESGSKMFLSLIKRAQS